MNRFEITEAKLLGEDEQQHWEPAGKHLAGKRVFVDAQTAMIARDRAARFFLLSIDHIRLTLTKDPATAAGVLLVVGEMGAVSAKELEAPNGTSKTPGGVPIWPRVSDFRSGFATIMVRANDLSDDELRAELVQFLSRHGSKPTKKRARR